MKITLLIPTLNEIGGMKEIMPKIKKEWYDQLIVVDGGSTDGTVEYARDNGYFVFRQKNKGIRFAYIEALEYITGDVVITFSPDGNSIAELIPELTAKMKEGYDMVIVSRYAKGAKSYDDGPVTGFGNWMFTTLINVLHGGRYTDAMVMFRAWRKDIFKQLELDKEESYRLEEKIFRTKIGVEPLLSVRAARAKLKCADIAGDEPPRIGGERKLKIIQWGSAYLFEVLREALFDFRKRRN
ncbi:MAG: histidinol phosphate phosphatase [Candidatus Omnitrophica bacterium CG11_big_fil_rev_8_21_14_0_20_42_13]|uniref:Histidinol phosphate phosphatase n=1 Tax=Candidatus Ghiorseimicrobium undicola TaxID=1974746 RepID=A0A2H0LZ11_9BACT|nr:MAG: histidinol phosphate phosphatase [Candidatus Omnitrophica bacterium CG11_big_fil_rev_8_21_14_0_20_42_13]